jgi:hypothetical protein
VSLRERLELVLFEKVEHAHAKQLGYEANVIAKVEHFDQVDAFAVKMGGLNASASWRLLYQDLIQGTHYWFSGSPLRSA